MVKITDSEFAYLVDYIKKNYGMNLAQKRVLLEGRLASYLEVNGFKDYTSYIKAIEADKTAKEITNLLNKVTTNHTYFMREADHFEFFGKKVLPVLEQEARDRDLRIWCAASSTGEEPYTLAIILDEYFSNRGTGWDKTILATDLSVKVLEIAKRGEYAAEALKDMPENWKRKYFKPCGDGNMRVVDSIRSQVVFRQFNLMDPIVAKKPYHVVFCRNVMIYFDAPTKAAVVDHIYQAMRPGGYLFVGHTESVAKPTPFQYVMPSVYRKGV